MILALRELMGNVLFCTRDAQSQSYDDGHVEPRKRSTKSLPVVLGSSSKWRRSVFKSRWACVLKQAAPGECTP